MAGAGEDWQGGLWQNGNTSDENVVLFWGNVLELACVFSWVTVAELDGWQGQTRCLGCEGLAGEAGGRPSCELAGDPAARLAGRQKHGTQPGGAARLAILK